MLIHRKLKQKHIIKSDSVCNCVFLISTVLSTHWLEVLLCLRTFLRMKIQRVNQFSELSHTRSAVHNYLTLLFIMAILIQIRGFLSRFQNVLPASQRFDKCTACSDTVGNHILYIISHNSLYSF